MKDAVLQFRGFDRELRNKFRSLCVARGESMKDAIERYMREEVERADRERSK